MRLPVFIPLLILLPFFLTACNSSPKPGVHTRKVTATAYTTAEDETKKGNVGLTAWGDHLKPGMKAIAVSRDLIDKGLTHGVAVKIEGLKGKYIVRDKMNKRWTDKIDILMDTKQEARQWGKRQVNITWKVPKPTPK